MILVGGLVFASNPHKFKEIDLILSEYVYFVSVDRRQILVSLHMDASLFFLIVSMYDCCLNKY